MLVFLGLLIGGFLAYVNLKLSAEVDGDEEPKNTSIFIGIALVVFVFAALIFTPTSFSMSLIAGWLVPFIIVQIDRQT
jgi:Flp pilus assembly protein TadB